MPQSKALRHIFMDLRGVERLVVASEALCLCGFQRLTIRCTPVLPRFYYSKYY